jgi:hypothetical protein
MLQTSFSRDYSKINKEISRIEVNKRYQLACRLSRFRSNKWPS